MALRSDSMHAVVSFRVPGFHRWPEATGARAYLAHRHRHLFHVTVWLQLRHDEREVEFHDLLDDCLRLFPGGELADDSCETMARTLAARLGEIYPRRALTVQVLEDGEVGAEYSAEPV